MDRAILKVVHPKPDNDVKEWCEEALSKILFCSTCIWEILSALYAILII